MIVGRVNDVILYRELLKRGVSEYLVAPVAVPQLMESLSNLYNDPEADPVGHVYSFIGAKGGVGSSTICHNAAWILSEALQSDVIVADLDLAFGTTGLDFNQDPVQGIAEALATPERLDEVLLDRLLTKCSQHLSIFAAPVVLDRDYEISPDSCDMVIHVRPPERAVCRGGPASRLVRVDEALVLQSDEVVITAVPDLANLRNAKNICDLLNRPQERFKAASGHQHGQHAQRRALHLPSSNRPWRLKALSVIDFDPETFGQASNRSDVPRTECSCEVGSELPRHRDDARPSQGSQGEKKSPLAPLLEKLKLKR